MLKGKYSVALKDVYYALKCLCEKNRIGAARIEVFLKLDLHMKHKDTLEILNQASWSKSFAGAYCAFMTKSMRKGRSGQWMMR